MDFSLPSCQLRTRRLELSGEVQVYDRLRRRYVALTPEEFVRQHFVAYLIDRLGYPEGLMANEVAISLNRRHKRCDTVVFDREGRPAMIVEYKAPSVVLTQKVFDQIARYNMALHTRYLMVSNGLTHYCCKVSPEYDGYEFLTQMPSYQEITGE